MQTEKEFPKWASYSDLKEMDPELMQKAIEASYYYCYDACNLCFTMSSSTSGMYASWAIEVDPGCTVYLSRTPPRGYGNHINKALESFIADCEKNAALAEAKEKPKAYYFVEETNPTSNRKRTYITEKHPGENDHKNDRYYNVKKLVEESKLQHVLRRVSEKLEYMKEPTAEKIATIKQGIDSVLKELE